MNSFKGFNGPVTSIIQSNTTGNILVTCNDGKVYLLTPPNLDYYLSNNANQRLVNNKEKYYIITK